MMYHSKNLKLKTKNSKLKTAFSLVETVTALAILAIISSSVLVVINRCVTSTADSAIRRQAFEVARDNMETLLTSTSVSEDVEAGFSDKYPEIQWETTVEPFYEPVSGKMWVQATCSAEYTDTAGELQTVELTHWLTGLNKDQLLEIIKQRQKQEEWLPDEIIETDEEAADYAGVDVETIEQWVENGMPLTDDGEYIKDYLDLYEEHNGNPPAVARNELAKEIEEQKEQSQEEQPEREEEPKDDEETEPLDPREECGGIEDFCKRIECYLKYPNYKDYVSFEDAMRYAGERN